MANIILVGALPSSLVNFRGELLRAFRNEGHSVIAMAAEAKAGHRDVATEEKLKEIGVAYRTFPVQRNGLNPVADLQSFATLRRVFSRTAADAILAYTIKPVIWGGLAARSQQHHTRFYALITGLGFAFQGETLKRRVLSRLVTNLYREALRNADKVIFQNPDNLAVFVSRRIVPRHKCELVNGSGVDTEHFAKTDLPNGAPVFLLIARLLGEKGIREYYAAAKQIKKNHPDVSFQLVGPEDPSPDGIPLSEINAWHAEGTIEYLGATKDVRPFIERAHIYVLPSYHEGMPRTVLEAMSIGRPILTTNVPGCRETVIDGENGYMVPKGDANALAKQMTWFIEHRSEWQQMADASRRMAETRFDVDQVNRRILDIMKVNAPSG